MYFFNRIAFKVCSIIILVELIVFAFIGVYYIANFSSQLEKHVAMDIKTPALLINQGVLTYGAIEEKSVLSEIVGSEFEEGLIIGLNKRVFHSTNKDFIGQTIAEFPSLAFVNDFFDPTISEPKIIFESNEKGKFLHCLSPLFAAGGKSARFFVYLKMNTTWIQNQTRHLAGLYTISSLVCILITSALIFTVLHDFIFSKLARLTKAYDNVRQGLFKSDFPEKMLTSKDEIGILSRGFQAMTENLAETTTSIDNLNNEIYQRELAEQNLKQAKEMAEDATKAKSL
ncbi:MAG: hypothetical protein P8X55_15335, partial [Desulfosarcinaceae bacterium]